MTELDKLCDEFADLMVKEFKMMELLKYGGQDDPQVRAVYEIVHNSLHKRINEIGDKIYEGSK